jgi:hypothetical protein
MQNDSRRSFPRRLKTVSARQVLFGSIGLVVIALILFIGLRPASAPAETPADLAGAMPDTLLKTGCQIIQQIKYTPCGHSITRRMDLPAELVGKTRADLEQAYDQYRVTEFMPEQVSMATELSIFCAAHVILMPDETGVLCIFENKYGDALMLKSSLELSLTDLPDALREEVKKGKGFDDTKALEQWLEAAES